MRREGYVKRSCEMLDSMFEIEANQGRRGWWGPIVDW